MRTIAIMIVLASLSACSSFGMGEGSSGSSGSGGYTSGSVIPQNDPEGIYFGG